MFHTRLALECSLLALRQTEALEFLLGAALFLGANFFFSSTQIFSKAEGSFASNHDLLEGIEVGMGLRTGCT